jgi:hypothetical protein
MHAKGKEVLRARYQPESLPGWHGTVSGWPG